MENIRSELKTLPDLTTVGTGVDPDAAALVLHRPQVRMPVPGQMWHGNLGGAKAVIRLPEKSLWNGRIMIGATPAVRSEFSLDLLLSDIVLQRGYAFAACDKGTPMLVMRDPNRQMTEWQTHYLTLTETTKQLVKEIYGEAARRTYISGVSNGGYITRIMLERYPHEFDGGVEWEGVYWHPDRRHILTCLPTYLREFPIYHNFRGDRTESERARAFEQLVAAGLHPESAPHWAQYFYAYWIVSLWLYGRNLDPDWAPFAEEWSNHWLKDPIPIADYPWESRTEILRQRIEPIANSGLLKKPLLSVAGNWDSLVSFRYNAQAYAEAVRQSGAVHFHRLYEIDRGNHVDGLLREAPGKQQPVLPYYEAAISYLEDWIEQGILPPESGRFEHLEDFAPDKDILSCKLPN